MGCAHLSVVLCDHIWRIGQNLIELHSSKLCFNLWPFFPSSSFECSLFSIVLCLVMTLHSAPAASGSYALHTILSREVVFLFRGVAFS